VAAIAAGMFAALGSRGAAAGERTADGSSQAIDKAESNWKSVSRREALR